MRSQMKSAARSAPAAGETTPADGSAQLHVLCRSLVQLEAALAAGVRSTMVDFQDIRQYAEAVVLARDAGAKIWLATPRIQKPDEAGIFRVLARHEADGMLATCLQHEMDHLEGVLFIDHLSKLKRAMLLKKLTKAKKLAV